MVQPEINIEVNLPTAWNGRLYMFGNGGWAGEVVRHARDAWPTGRKGLKAGFVTAATDTGHSAALEPGASFALNRQKLLDFGFRSLHVTAETAKMLARTYYGAAPTKSYYEGCSQGGRQGLTLAQRFPERLRRHHRGRARAEPDRHAPGARLLDAGTACQSISGSETGPAGGQASTSSAMRRTA